MPQNSNQHQSQIDPQTADFIFKQSKFAFFPNLMLFHISSSIVSISFMLSCSFALLIIFTLTGGEHPPVLSSFQIPSALPPFLLQLGTQTHLAQLPGNSGKGKEGTDT